MEERNTYRNLVLKLERKTPLGRPGIRLRIILK
jgi:hypothetical protein